MLVSWGAFGKFVRFSLNLFPPLGSGANESARPVELWGGWNELVCAKFLVRDDTREMTALGTAGQPSCPPEICEAGRRSLRTMGEGRGLHMG